MVGQKIYSSTSKIEALYDDDSQCYSDCMLRTITLVCLSTVLAVEVARAATKDPLEAAYKRGDFRVAENLATERIKYDNRDIIARYYLANIYARSGNYEDAFSNYAFCAEFGKNTPVGKYASAALESLQAQKANKAYQVPAGSKGAEAAGKATANTIDSMKEALLKEGSGKIETRRKKLGEDLEKLKTDSDRESLKYLPERLREQYRNATPAYLANIEGDPGVAQYIESRRRYDTDKKKIIDEANRDIDKLNKFYIERVEDLDRLNGARRPAQANGVRDSRTVKNYINYGDDDVVDSIPREPAMSASPTSMPKTAPVVKPVGGKKAR